MNTHVREGLTLAMLVGAMASTGAVTENFTVDHSVSAVCTTAAVVNVTASTLSQGAAYPTSVGDPIFWVDATCTNGWQFGSESGAVTVTNLPSRVGSRRLTSDRGSWWGWHDGSASGSLGTHRSPLLVTDTDTFGGKPVLDFGITGSRRMLVFDPDPASVEAGASTNVLRQIGTVIQVRNSEKGGGWLFGGGDLGNDPTSSSAANYGWHRGTGLANAAFSWYASPVAVSHMQDPAEKGILYHHGFVSSPTFLGYDGKWETLSLQCTSASAVATGIGINDCRWNHAGDSGGFKLAEMLVYDRVLTRAEIVLVEMYLEQKWFGRNRPGWNGDARVGRMAASRGGDPVASSVNVPAGTTLTIGRLEGGHSSATGNYANLRKTGAGAVVLNDADRFGGKVELAEGSIEFPSPRPLPTALPYNVYLRFDTSVAGSLDTTTVNGTNFVTCWRDVSGTKYRSQPVVLRPLNGVSQSRIPWVRADALGTGKDVVDFGDLSASGCALKFCTNETLSVDSAVSTLDSPAMVFAVIGAQRGGGNLFNTRPFMRNYDGNVSSFNTSMFYHKIESTIEVYSTDGGVWVNGRKRGTSEGYESPGYQVVAFQSPGGSSPNVLGACSGHAYFGGMRIAELVIYARTLTEREVEDVQAYLSNKWLGHPTAGYAGAAADATKPDLRYVEVVGASEINVGAGTTAVVSRLSLLEPLRKTGAGELWVNEIAVTNHGVIDVVGGEVHVKAGSDVSATSELAANASLHLDASAADTLDVLDGTLRYWNSADGATADGAFSYASTRRPTVIANAVGTKSAVDFGPYNTSVSKSMVLARPMHSIRSVYMVVSYCNQGPFVLGSQTGAPNYDPGTYNFHGSTVSVAEGGLFYANNYCYPKLGEIYTNGVKIAYNTPVPSNTYMLVELHLTKSAFAGALGHDRATTDRQGGFRLGEIVAYERDLTERERLATRNYLAEKWFGTAPTELPAKPAAPADVLPHNQNLEVSGERSLTLATDATVARIFGEGTFEKDGAGTLTVKSMGGMTGTVSVAEGKLEIVGVDATNTPRLATEGLIYHADSTKGIVSVTTNESHLTLRTWASALGDGWTAVSSSSSNNRLQMVDPDVGGLDTLRIGGCYFRFQKDGAYARLDNIRTVLWMIGSQEGGGWLMGGGTNRNVSGDSSLCPWHRGQVKVDGTLVAGTTNTCTYLHDGVGFLQLKGASWRWNQQKTTYSTGYLSGGWDLLSVVVKTDDDYVNADGLCYDGRKYNNAGNQRLGELLVYDRRLDDTELFETESYLACRWSCRMHEAATNVTLRVADGAEADLGATAQAFASITGAGTFTGSVSVGALTADASLTVDDVPVVTGALSAPNGLTVELTNLPSDLQALKIPLATVGSGVSVSDVEFVGDSYPASAAPYLRYSGNLLYVRFPAGGTLIQLR